jgi:hypothetical protein
MPTLLEQAKTIPTSPVKKELTEEDLDLVLAWLNDEVSATQICKVLKKSKATGNYLYYFSTVIKKFYKNGKLVIKKV